VIQPGRARDLFTLDHPWPGAGRAPSVALALHRPGSAATLLLGALMVLSLLSGACASAARDTERRASDEIEAGYKAARHGYWQEALLRFERANAMKPQQARILNNLAVSLEAVGRYDEARATYENGLHIDPGDRNLKRNYERFKEMYASLIERPEEDEKQQQEQQEQEAAAGAGEDAGPGEDAQDEQQPQGEPGAEVDHASGR
jgi:tetratricopeptide (TPR) repeat protein